MFSHLLPQGLYVLVLSLLCSDRVQFTTLEKPFPATAYKQAFSIPKPWSLPWEHLTTSWKDPVSFYQLLSPLKHWLQKGLHCSAVTSAQVNQPHFFCAFLLGDCSLHLAQGSQLIRQPRESKPCLATVWAVITLGGKLQIVSNGGIWPPLVVDRYAAKHPAMHKTTHTECSSPKYQ